MRGVPAYRGVQLASEYRGLPFPVAIEPKIDGYRMAAIVGGDGRVTLYSRYGNTAPYNDTLDFLAREIEAFRLEPGTMLDGEILVGDWNTTGLIRKTRPTPQDKAQLFRDASYWVFDLVSPSAPMARLDQRKTIMSQRLRQTWGHGGHVMPIPSFIARNQQEVNDFTTGFLQRGYEGSIVKNLAAPYTYKRDANWQKIKQFKTFEITPTAYIQGTGKYRGMLGAIQGTDPQGRTLRVGTGFTDAQRRDIWAHKPMNKRIEVRVQESDVSEARHPSFMRFREDDDRGNPSRSFIKKTYAAHVDHVRRLGCDEKTAKSIWSIAKYLDTEPENIIRDPNTGDESCEDKHIKKVVESRITDCESYPRKMDAARIFMSNASRFGSDDFTPMSLTTARKRAREGQCFANIATKPRVATAVLQENGILDDNDYNTHRVETLLRSYSEVFGSDGPSIAQALLGCGYGYATLMDAIRYIPNGESNVMRLVYESIIPYHVTLFYSIGNPKTDRIHAEELKRDPQLMKSALLGFMGSGRHRRRIERLFSNKE